MSNTITQRPREQALWDAQDFRAMLEPFCEVWMIAGSVRRGVAQVGDVDHVVVPKVEAVPVVGSGGLFGGGDDVKHESLLWRELDRLVDRRATRDDQLLPDDEFEWGLEKTIKSDGRTRWGERYRSVQFRGHTHEVYTTTPEAMGIALLIRTGPADFSRFVVTELKKHGYRAKDGIVERRAPGSGGGDYAGVSGPPSAEQWEPVAVPTERDVFDLIGVTYREPNQRGGRW